MTPLLTGYLNGLGAVIFVIGTAREIVAMRRGSGRLLLHALRVLAFLMAASDFFVVKYLDEANPPPWSVVLCSVLIPTAAGILVLTGRVAVPDRPGKDADRGQESKIAARS